MSLTTVSAAVVASSCKPEKGSEVSLYTPTEVPKTVAESTYLPEPTFTHEPTETPTETPTKEPTETPTETPTSTEIPFNFLWQGPLRLKQLQTLNWNPDSWYFTHTNDGPSQIVDDPTGRYEKIIQLQTNRSSDDIKVRVMITKIGDVAFDSAWRFRYSIYPDFDLGPDGWWNIFGGVCAWSTAEGLPDIFAQINVLPMGKVRLAMLEPWGGDKSETKDYPDKIKMRSWNDVLVQATQDEMIQVSLNNGPIISLKPRIADFKGFGFGLYGQGLIPKGAKCYLGPAILDAIV